MPGTLCHSVAHRDGSRRIATPGLTGATHASPRRYSYLAALLSHPAPEEMSVALYAAYGSNLDPEQMAMRAPHSPLSATGWLVGWRLTFAGEDIGWEGSLATVVEDRDNPDARVFVVLYDVSDEDVHTMDRWEGSELGLHRKLRARIETTDGPALAWLYVVDGFEGGLPSARYLGVMADAAEIAGAPAEYVHDLRTRPSRNIGPGHGG